MTTSDEKPMPSEGDLDDIRDRAWDIMDRRIARWREAQAFAERARELAGIDRRLDRWAELESAEACHAERALVRAILATAPDYNLYRSRPEKHAAAARGVISGKLMYLAYPDPYRDGEPEGDDKPDVMRLLVVDRAAIVDATAGLPPAIYSPIPMR